MRVEPIDSIYKYKNLVWHCIEDMQVPDHCERDDLVQQGYLGLLEAEKRFNPDKGVKFITYAYYYVKGYILRHVYKNLSLLSGTGLVNLGKRDYSQLNLYRMAGNLNDFDNNDDSLLLVGRDGDFEKIESKLDYYKLKKAFDLFINLISPQQKRAIELYYFIPNNNGKKRTYRDVAEEMGVSFERVRQLIVLGKKALRKRFGEYLDVYV